MALIIPPRPSAVCLHGQLSSNVRPHLAWSCKRRGIGLRSKQAGGASRRVEVLRRLHHGQGRRARRPVLTALAPLRAASGSPPSAAPGAATLGEGLRARVQRQRSCSSVRQRSCSSVLQRINGASLLFGCGASLGMLAGRLHIAPSARSRLRTECGLTTRSSRPAPAGAAWPLRAIVDIVPPRPVGPCLLGRLSSNVRPHLAWSCKRRGIGLRSEQAGGACRRVEVLRRLQYGRGRRARRPVITALAPLRAASGSPPAAAPGAATLGEGPRAPGTGAAPLQLAAAAHQRRSAGLRSQHLAWHSLWPLAHRPFRSLSDLAPESRSS
jgi:hypothetical protein